MITQKKLVVWGLIIVVIGFFFGYIAGQGNKTANQLSVISYPSSVSLMFDYGDGMVRTYMDIAVTASTTVLDATKTLTEREKLEFKAKDYGDMGSLVEQIGLKKNGSEGKYWQYWVNNVSSQVAADKLSVKAGDVIEWKFLNYK